MKNQQNYENIQITHNTQHSIQQTAYKRETTTTRKNKTKNRNKENGTSQLQQIPRSRMGHHF